MRRLPPLGLAMAVLGVVLGVAVGLGIHTFLYARGYSYLLDDPRACANCHVMEGHFAAWLKSSHRAVATCNACHTPHGLLPKYASKATNGFFHALAFTTGQFPDPLRARSYNQDIVQHACLGCHQAMTAAIALGHPTPAQELRCVRCHPDVGHGPL